MKHRYLLAAGVLAMGCASGQVAVEDAAPAGPAIVQPGDGYVMYTKQESFAAGGIVARSTGCALRSVPEYVCQNYPMILIEEWWESTDSLGIVDEYYGRMSTLDGTVLATAVQGEWTDVENGFSWSVNSREGRELVHDVGIAFGVIESRNFDGLVGTEGELGGRPSLVFSVADKYAGGPNTAFTPGESELQVAVATAGFEQFEVTWSKDVFAGALQASAAARLGTRGINFRARKPV